MDIDDLPGYKDWAVWLANHHPGFRPIKMCCIASRGTTFMWQILSGPQKGTIFESKMMFNNKAPQPRKEVKVASTNSRRR